MRLELTWGDQPRTLHTLISETAGPIQSAGVEGLEPTTRGLTGRCSKPTELHSHIFQITLRARGDSNPRMSVLQTDVLAASPLAHVKPNEIVVLQSPGTSLLHSSTVIAPKPLGFSGFTCFITRFLYRFPENFLQR